MNALSIMRQPTDAEIEIERAALGLLFEGSETAWFVLDRVQPEDMLEPLHRRAVLAVRRVLDTGGEPNALTVAAAMASDAGLNEVGGSDYFRNLTRGHVRNAKIAAEICEALSDQAQRRALAHEIASTEQRLRDNMVSAREVLAEHQQAVQALLEGKPQADDPGSLFDAARAVVDRLDAPEELRKPLVPYGVAGLDESIGGMAPGDLIIVGARPGMGKSAFALAIAHHVAARNTGALFMSLEMKRGQLAERWLSMRSYAAGHKIPYNLIRLNRLHDTQKDALADAASKIATMPLQIDERRGMTVGQITVRARSVASKLRRAGTPLGLLIIDHLHLIEPDGDYRGSMVAETTRISKALKILAGALDVPVICLSQLNRGVEGRDDKRPALSDLRESGAIEQDADVVLLLHRPEYYARKGEPDSVRDPKKHTEWLSALENSKGFINIVAAKVRHGAEDEIKAECEIAYNWIGERMT